MHATRFAGLPPVSPLINSERIVSLDVLRGFALLGILLMNIQSFAQPHYDNPFAFGDFHGANFGVWAFSHTFAHLKFLSIFSMLFGAGVYLFSSRLEAAGRSSAWLHYRRMLVLIAFGLIHAYLFWFGDILVHYGICGMLVYPFRKPPPHRLVAIAAFLLAVPIITGVFYIRAMSPEDVQEFQSSLQPTAERIAADLIQYRGGWLAQEPARASAALEFETTLFAWEYFWRELGLMFLGIALFQWGVFSASLPKIAYARMIAAAVLVGIPLTLYGIYANYDAGWKSVPIFFRGELLDYLGSLFVAFGWVAAVMLLCQSQRLQPLLRPLQAVGRAAFSNYILQTVLCTTLFYGHGFGLYGSVSRVGQLGIVLLIWALQLLISSLWFRHFRMGPLEAAWRSLTYWKPQPLRKSAAMSGLTCRTA